MRMISQEDHPHPVIVTIRDNKGHIKVRVYSYYTTNTGQGVLPNAKSRLP